MFQEHAFRLRTGEAFIPLNSLLKVLNLAGTGGEANMHIDNGEVLLNGTTETRRRRKVRAGDVVLFGQVRIVVTA